MFFPIADISRGNFDLLAHSRSEIRTTAAAFVRSVHVCEGQPVRKGQCLAELEIPGLSQQIAQRSAALQEAQADLERLQAGPRPEVLEAQERRVKMARRWRAVAWEKLQQRQEVFQYELAQLRSRLDQAQAELVFAHTRRQLLDEIRDRGSVGRTEWLEAVKNVEIAEARCELIRAEHSARQAEGTLIAQSELAEREKMLVDEEAELRVLAVGARVEELRAARCKIKRLREELNELTHRQSNLRLHSPIDGIVSTPRPFNRVGQYFAEGDLVLEVEDGGRLDVVIEVREQEATDIVIGNTVELRARSLPLSVLPCVVSQIAPRAEPGELQSTVSLYGELRGADQLKPGMSGMASINCGRKPLGIWLLTRIRRMLRTNMW